MEGNGMVVLVSDEREGPLARLSAPPGREGRHTARSVVVAVALTLLAVGVSLSGAAGAAAHSGGWGFTRGGAQEALLSRVLYPHGDYYGVSIDSVRVRCVGDFASPSFVIDQQRYFNHLFCTLSDTEGRGWTLKVHPSGPGNWLYSNLRETSGSGGSTGGTLTGTHFKTPSHNIVCWIEAGPLTCGRLNGGDFARMTSYGAAVSYYPREGILDDFPASVLAYGKTWHRGSFTCDLYDSSRLRCVNQGGHGFRISKESLSTW